MPSTVTALAQMAARAAAQIANSYNLSPCFDYETFASMVTFS